ncbi:MAG: ATP-dependent 6-phosphofructokinase [Pseudomonadota bacterium]
MPGIQRGLVAKMRIGILTGGGDCPGLNAVIRAVVKKAVYDCGWEVWGIADGYEGLVEGRGRNISTEDASNILGLGGTILGTSNTANPFEYVRRVRGKLVTSDESKRALGQIKKWRLDALVAVGGDGTLSIAERLGRIGAKVVGIPKTIDNDLNATDITFGHDSAVQVISNAIDNLHTTAQSHHRVIVVEVMGRYAGWLALRGGMAGGGDVILIPEIPFSLDSVVEEIELRRRKGRRFSIVVVAEGAHEKGKGLVVRQKIEGSPDPLRLGGIGAAVSNAIEDKTGISSRIVVLGHLQRGGTPTAFDRLLATDFGIMAVSVLKDGKSGRMVAMKGGEVTDVPIASAITKLKTVPKNHPLVLAAKSMGTVLGD